MLKINTQEDVVIIVPLQQGDFRINVSLPSPGPERIELLSLLEAIDVACEKWVQTKIN